ncbi:hypothetical protein P9112_011195 [Eukaryota sp. TZLM1-RC]
MFSCSLCHKDINIINDCELQPDEFSFSDMVTQSFEPFLDPEIKDSLISLGESMFTASDPHLPSSKINSLLSETTNQDLPLCTLCLADTVRKLEQERDHLQLRISSYQESLTRLDTVEASFSSLDLDINVHELHGMMEEQSKLLEAEFHSYQNEINLVTFELAEAQKQQTLLDEEIEQLWKKTSNVVDGHLSLVETQSLEENQINSIQEQILALECLDPLFIMVNISVDSERPSALVNHNALGVDLTLSELSHQSSIITGVNWISTNTALGDLCLLLVNAAKLVSFKLRNMVPMPQGRSSTVLRLSDGCFLPLFGPPFGSNSGKKSKKSGVSFDDGLSGFINVLFELYLYCKERLEESFKFELPYHLTFSENEVFISHGDSKFGLLLRSYGINSSTDVEKFKGERCLKWTSAMRLLAINLQQIVVYCRKLNLNN